jgi:AraC-like DNA-binding protein
MYDQYGLGDLIYIMFYGAAAMLSLTACCYLLFRRANAIAPDVMSPVRLRRWTAAFFASMTLSHIWYLPVAFSTSREDVLLSNIVGAVLDFMTLIPLAIVVLLVMLQDRRRPLWLIFLMMTPLIIGLVVCGVSRSVALSPLIYIYYLLLAISLIIYLIRATRQYGRWLRDNYADLEHKEVWQSFVIVAIILLVFFFYAFESQAPANKYVTQLNNIILVCLLLWRVETLSDLSIPVNDAEEETGATEDVEDNDLPISVRSRSTLVALPAKNIGLLLQQHCIDKQLYLQHDLTILQLAKAIGTNRFYLSQYFSNQGTTYNTYINNLRINYFISLYQEAIASHRPFTAQQLASESGYRSYSTFRRVFKQQMGQNVREWMGDTDQNCPNQQK